jgi:hypothetical protein
MLAEVYERKDEKGNAIRWYEEARKYIKDSGMVEELDNKLKSLK